MPFRRTKIIATLGPATQAPEKLRALLVAGANVFRLNMSHASEAWVRQIVADARQAALEVSKDVSILMDLRGPSIRTGDLDESWNLVKGDHVEFRTSDNPPTTRYSVDVNYPFLGQDVHVGDTMLVDNGVLHMRVLETSESRVTCEVIVGGKMGSRRHINLPGVKVNLPALTPKDLEDINLGVEVGVDFVAMSFARNAEHVHLLRQTLETLGSQARIVSKIEDQQALANLNGIIRASDVVMIARGDLGIEVPIEDLPVIQRQILRECILEGCPVIVATHMLESMTSSPVPTRAEVTDVANAVFEEADAVMLSGETSTGAFPIQCVEVLDRVSRKIEAFHAEGSHHLVATPTNEHKMAHSAVSLANSLPHAHLLTFTKEGRKARLLANQRPLKAPIFAFTPCIPTLRSMNLMRSVVPFYTEEERAGEEAIVHAINLLKSEGRIQTGDSIIVFTESNQEGLLTESLLLREV